MYGSSYSFALAMENVDIVDGSFGLDHSLH